MKNYNIERRNFKTQNISIKCSQNEKERIIRNAKKQNKSISQYVVDCAMAAQENRKTRDKKRASQMVCNQVLLEQLKNILAQRPDDAEVNETMKLLEEGMNRLWEN